MKAYVRPHRLGYFYSWRLYTGKSSLYTFLVSMPVCVFMCVHVYVCEWPVPMLDCEIYDSSVCVSGVCPRHVSVMHVCERLCACLTDMYGPSVCVCVCVVCVHGM